MEIKSYKPGDEIKIIELFEQSFGKKMSLEYWKWRFLENPFTSNVFIDLMWDNDLLVGHYAVSPMEMILEDKKILTALSMTTMTHPQYAGKGIFSKLAENLYKRLTEEGYVMVWGFPNNNSHYGFNKNLNWKDIALQGMMSIKSDVIKQKIVDSEFEIVNNFDSINTVVFQNKDKVFGINKTPKYMNWRYFSNTSADYNVIVSKDKKAGIVYKKIKSFTNSSKFEIDIMEINFNNDINLLEDLILKVISAENDVLQFNVWDSLFSNNQIPLEKIGFRIGAPVTYLGARLFSENKLITDYRNWDISFGYSDVF